MCKIIIIERWIYGLQLQTGEYNGVPFVKQSVPGIAVAGKRQVYVIGTYATMSGWLFLFDVFIPSQPVVCKPINLNL